MDIFAELSASYKLFSGIERWIFFDVELIKNNNEYTNILTYSKTYEQTKESMYALRFGISRLHCC